MLLSLVVSCCLVASTFGLPQRSRSSSESPGKPGEKSLRSLDQVSYNDGFNRGRSNLKDSYGNPVAYDTLEQVDSKQPSKNPADPNQFLIPGYASGILQPHEVPTRSNFDGESPRSIDDDRIHFIDPLQNSFQNSDKSFQAPSSSLSPPSGSSNNEPINIPRPNIDLNETPQAPVDDPLNHSLNPPSGNSFGEPQAPAVALQVPQGKTPQFGLPQDLSPPQIPANNQAGVFIPRPNLDISETPIDNSNGPLNQGLLPPTDGSKTTFDSTVPSFVSPSQNGPIVFTEGNVNFAPKPSNGLLPPKDPSPNDINFQDPVTTTTATINKFSFGGSSGILGNTGVSAKIPEKVENTVNKFTGSFGGAPGVLGGSPALASRLPTPTQIPVVVVQAPAPAATSSVLLPPSPTVNKYEGGFGGPSGVLVNEQYEKTASTQVSPTVSLVAPTVPTVLNNKFGGSFGGVLGDKPSVVPSIQTPTTLAQLPTLNDVPQVTVNRGSQKYTGNFGGLPGVLLPYDGKN